MGGRFLSSGCPQPAPCPAAARSRVPTCFPSAGDKIASMGTGQSVAPRPGSLSLGEGRARLRPRRSPAGAAAARWAHLLLSPRVRVLCGDSAAGPESAAAGRAAACGWEARCWPGSRGTSLQRGLCRAGSRSGRSGRGGRSRRGGDSTGLMAAPGWEGAPEPDPSAGREGGAESWDAAGSQGTSVVCPSALSVPHLQAPFSSGCFNSRAGAAGERVLGTPSAGLRCSCAVPVAGCGGGSARFESLLDVAQRCPNHALPIRGRGCSELCPGGKALYFRGLPRGPGCAPGLRAEPCRAVLCGV